MPDNAALTPPTPGSSILGQGGWTMPGMGSGVLAGCRWLARGVARFCLLTCTVLVSLAQQPSAAPDRIVAEWMIRMGGSVILEGQRRPITDLAILPTSDFRIHGLDFTGITQWGFALEDELRRL